MKNRRESDCKLLTAAICCAMEMPGCWMLIGALCAEYQSHPDAKFWDVVEDILGYKKKYPLGWEQERRIVEARSQFVLKAS